MILQEDQLHDILQSSPIDIRSFYNKLWRIHFPTKIKLLVWQATWSYIPTFEVLHQRWLLNVSLCPKCGIVDESLLHAFRKYLASVNIWKDLSFEWVVTSTEASFWGWVTWVFKYYSDESVRVFCCLMWAIWFDRNQWVHEKKYKSS